MITSICAVFGFVIMLCCTYIVFDETMRKLEKRKIEKSENVVDGHFETAIKD